MNPIEHILTDFPLMILDGALATELERYGCDLNDPLWSAKVLLEKPRVIKQVHTDYFEAGADCAITASYQATVKGYRKRGLSEIEAAMLIKQSVELAVEARDAFWSVEANQLGRPKPLVAASVGPYGAYLADGSEYHGDYGLCEEELVLFHRERIRLLVEAGADVLACETIPCLVEAKAIARVLKDFPDVYAWISFSAKDELHINSGELIADCAEWLEGETQIAAVGINCTAPQFVESLITEVKANTAKPIIVYPNSGEAYDPESKQWSDEDADEPFVLSTKRWFEAGATVIGGCCRTTPKDIRGICEWARG
ncbi:homocysteine S-methyltransferase [Alkalihalobacillus sp. FSL W8-0930]